ncbi:MAG: hypothetical protein WC444_00900 [Candidatus Paceibacterota bacterium]
MSDEITTTGTDATVDPTTVAIPETTEPTVAVPPADEMPEVTEGEVVTAPIDTTVTPAEAN